MKSAAVKIAAGLVCAALFGAVLLTASATASQPAAAQTATGTNGFTHRLILPPTSESLKITAGQTKTLDVAAWFAPRGEFIALGLRLLCPTIPAPSSSSKFLSITRQSEDNCLYDFTARPTFTSGTEAITLTATSVYVNPIGLATRQTRLIAVTFTIMPISFIRLSASLASDTHYVGRGQSIKIDASIYASDGPYAVSCGEATAISSMLYSVTRADAVNSPCSYTVTASKNAKFGSVGRFTVQYTSTGGDTRYAYISVIITNPKPAEQLFSEAETSSGTFPLRPAS